MTGTHEYLSVDEVADLVGVNRKTVYAAIHEGRLPALRLGRTLRVARADLVCLSVARPVREPRGRFARIARGA